VQTLDRAASLLRGALTIDGTARLLAELGFAHELLRLDATAVAELGLPGEITSARVTRSSGALRALVLELEPACSTRECLTRTADALARTSSELLWLVVAIQQATRSITIICWRHTGHRVRVVSLACDPAHVALSDAETLCSLAAVRDESDLLTHARWLDVLGREAITSRFFRALEQTVDQLAGSLAREVGRDARRELALLYVSRLIFLSFLQSKGWLNGDFSFLANGFTRCVEQGGHYQRRLLEPLFFGTLNTRVRARSARAREFGRVPFLNGGLFARSRLEKRYRSTRFSDEAFGNAYAALFSHYHFSGREDTADWSEASIDPEMLGKAFEALMRSSDRKSSGAFYTPQDLVENLTRRALDSVVDNLRSDPRLLEFVQGLKVLDPACGSGAFLVHLLERLSLMRRELGESGTIAEIRRRVLTTSIFGVDLNPTAVWLCELRLWLSIVIESDEVDPMRVVPLPNLDRHIRVGDSLAGGAFADDQSRGTGRNLDALRQRYARASGSRKTALARSLDRAERNAAIDVLNRRRIRLTSERKELLIALRTRDLFGSRQSPDRQLGVRLLRLREQFREASAKMSGLRDGAALPFSFGAHFSDIGDAGGFDIVIGNPPWVRVHRIAEASRMRLRHDFAVYRRAAWQAGAENAGAGRGFAAQIDLAALFVERGCDLLKCGGTLAYLLPSKLWQSLSGGGVREMLLERTDIRVLEDLSRSPSQFDAAVYPSLLVSQRNADSDSPGEIPEDRIQATSTSVVIHSRQGKRIWQCAQDRLPMDPTPGSPWLLVPESVRAAFDYVSHAAVPLHISRFGRPMLGVKTGCNDAFIVRVESLEGDIARIVSGERHGEIERELLRPVIRGEAVQPWLPAAPTEYIVWTLCDDGTTRRDLPPLARRWLAPYREALVRRTDLHHKRTWWSLFRTESADCERHRVIWADFGLTPRATVVAAGEPFVALNTCYVARCKTIASAYGLAAILNSPLAAAWLNILAEPARGGYHRYLGWTVAQMPIPTNWKRARERLAPLGERAMDNDVPNEGALLAACLDAYQLVRDDVQPLLSWSAGCD